MLLQNFIPEEIKVRKFGDIFDEEKFLDFRHVRFPLLYRKTMPRRGQLLFRGR